MKDCNGLRRAFGVDDDGFSAIPPKFGNVAVARLVWASEKGGCTYCFPHGPETTNATCKKHRRSWKLYRRKQYRPKR